MGILESEMKKTVKKKHEIESWTRDKFLESDEMHVDGKLYLTPQFCLGSILCDLALERFEVGFALNRVAL